MASIRRAYVLITAAFALQAATWAAIFLLRGLLDPSQPRSTSDFAFQIAVLVVTVPIWLAHWRWAGRLAAARPEERSADARRLYLLAMDSAFVLGALVQAQLLLRSLLSPLTGSEDEVLSALVRSTASLVVLLAVLRYNRQVLRADIASVGEPGRAPAFRRLVTFGLAGTGLVLWSNAAIGLLRSLANGIGATDAAVILTGGGLAGLAANALLGIGLWVWLWREAQRRFEAGSPDEERATLRKLYLYAVIVVTALTCIGSTALLMAGAFRLLLGLAPQGDPRDPLTTVLVSALIWAWHHRTLKGDALAAPEAPRQAGIRRLYDYLLAGVGLAAASVGLAGLVSVLIRLAAAAPIGDPQRELLAWSAAGLLAGLPVWVLPWRRARSEAQASGETAEAARDALPRKAYLYLALLVAALALIISAVYLIYRLVSLALGEADPQNDLGLDLARALAVAGIASGIWTYHFRVLRADGDLDSQARRGRLAELPTLIVDAGDGRLGHALLAALGRELVGLPVAAIGLSSAARDRLGASGADDAGPAEAVPTEAALAAIADAELLVLPWDALEVGGDQPELARAIAASRAHKLLLPTRAPGFDWAGVDRWELPDLVEQAVAAVRQLAAGAQVEPDRPLGVGAWVLLAIAGLILLLAIGLPIASLLARLF